jgi:hypothetical protein
MLREMPKITLADAPGRDRMIDDQAEDDLERAYAEPIKHRRTRRLRDQAWLVMVILQDSGMRPDEVFPMRIENIYMDSEPNLDSRGKNRQCTPMGGDERAHDDNAKGLVRE